jgi:hypothetical protein
MRFCTPTAIAAYEAVLDKVRNDPVNVNLTEGEMYDKLCVARDAYIREIRRE